MKNGYPEMEMVGELRVFENPQDVEYYGEIRQLLILRREFLSQRF